MLEIKVSLRVYTKGFSQDEVAAKFECAGDFGYSEGDKIGTSADKYYSETMWGKRSSRDNANSIDAHVTELLDWLDQRKYEFHKLVEKSKVKPDICCFLSSDNSQGSAVISSDILKRLSYFDLDIVLDVYV